MIANKPTYITIKLKNGRILDVDANLLEDYKKYGAEEITKEEIIKTSIVPPPPIQEEPFVCPICGKDFRTNRYPKNALRLHSKSHKI